MTKPQSYGMSCHLFFRNGARTFLKNVTRIQYLSGGNIVFESSIFEDSFMACMDSGEDTDLTRFDIWPCNDIDRLWYMPLVMMPGSDREHAVHLYKKRVA